jgi:hypothetical protein
MRASGVVSRGLDNQAAKRYPPAKQSTSKIPAVSRDTRQEAKRPPSPPIFLRFAFHCRRIRILALDPMARPTGRTKRIPTLRHDPLQAKLTGMMEDEGPVFLVQVLVEPDSRRGTSQNTNELCLPLPEGIAPQVDAVKLDQVEGPHEHAGIVAPVSDPFEQRDAVLTARHRLAIDDARAGAQAREGLDDEREAGCEVVAWAAVQLDALLLLARYDPDAVVLDFVPPLVARRSSWSCCGQARRDESDRQGTRTQRPHGLGGSGTLTARQYFAEYRQQDAGCGAPLPRWLARLNRGALGMSLWSSVARVGTLCNNRPPPCSFLCPPCYTGKVRDLKGSSTRVFGIRRRRLIGYVLCGNAANVADYSRRGLYLVPHVQPKEDKSAYQSGDSKHATCSIFCGFSCSHEV